MGRGLDNQRSIGNIFQVDLPDEHGVCTSSSRRHIFQLLCYLLSPRCVTCAFCFTVRRVGVITSVGKPNAKKFAVTLPKTDHKRAGKTEVRSNGYLAPLALGVL